MKIHVQGSRNRRQSKCNVFKLEKVRIIRSVLFLFAIVSPQLVIGQKNLSIKISPDKIIGRVDKKIYGQLLEHIYHSINGGLWGELLASRSFEPVAVNGWYIENNTLFSPPTKTGKLSFTDNNTANFDIVMQVKWNPYFIGVPAPWSGGKSDLRFVFAPEKNTEPVYAFHINADASCAFTFEKQTGTQKNRPVWDVIKTKQTNTAFINPQKWHTLQLKYQGTAFEIYWDSVRLFEYQTGRQKINCGLSVETEKTAGLFKNITVKSVNGRLYKGFPKSVLPPAVAPDWTGFGKGFFKLMNGQAKNRYYAQHITSAKNDEAGVKQGPLNIYKGEIYRGSVWAKGDGKALLTVKLQNGKEPVAMQKLGVPGSTWKKYSFEFHPVKSADSVSFAIAVRGGNVWVDQVSLMADSAKKNDGFRPDLYTAAAAIKPTTLRWPGGSFASGYHWKWGIGPQENRIRMPKMGWGDYDQNAFGTDEFIALCRKMNAEPVIVIPIGYDQPDTVRSKLIREAQEWLAYCNEPATGRWGKLRAKNGHQEAYNVKYWEIDNEMWEMGVEKYSSVFREFASALKQIDPTIKIIVCGDFKEKNVYRDSVLIYSSGRYMDYISLHHYEGPGNFAKGPVTSAKKYAEVAALIAQSPNPNMKIYVSEWNASELDWRTGLYAAGILNVFEKEPGIEMAAAALYLRRTDATGWNNAFINFDHKDLFVAPNYVAMKLWRDNYAPHRIEIMGGTDSLNVVATRSEKGDNVYFKVVNPSILPYKISLTINGGKLPDKARLQLISPGSLRAENTMQNKNKVAVKDTYALVKGKVIEIELPAFSAGVVSVPFRP